MALFGGLFGGKKHPNLDRVSLAMQNKLGLQLDPPGDDVMALIDAFTNHDMVGFENASSVEGMQELFRAKSLRATADPANRTMVLSVATREEIESEQKAEHGAVKVMHVGGATHHGTSRIIRSFGTPGTQPAFEPVPLPQAQTASIGAETAAVPPAFEHLEATERLCPVIVDLFVKFGQLTTADKEVIKKIRPLDYTLEARMVALERWKGEVTRRARGIHVREGGPTTLLASDGATQKSEEAILRRFDTFIHWLSKLIKALEHKGIKFHGKPVWLPH